MAESFIEHPEVAGKLLEYVRFYCNPSSPPEVLLRLGDGTSLSLKLHLRLKVEAEYYRNTQGDIEVLRRYEAVLAKR